MPARHRVAMNPLSLKLLMIAIHPQSLCEAGARYRSMFPVQLIFSAQRFGGNFYNDPSGYEVMERTRCHFMSVLIAPNAFFEELNIPLGHHLAYPSVQGLP